MSAKINMAIHAFYLPKDVLKEYASNTLVEPIIKNIIYFLLLTYMYWFFFVLPRFLIAKISLQLERRFSLNNFYLGHHGLWGYVV